MRAGAKARRNNPPESCIYCLPRSSDFGGGLRATSQPQLLLVLIHYLSFTETVCGQHLTSGGQFSEYATNLAYWLNYSETCPVCGQDLDFFFDS